MLLFYMNTVSLCSSQDNSLLKKFDPQHSLVKRVVYDLLYLSAHCPVSRVYLKSEISYAFSYVHLFPMEVISCGL